MKVVGSFFGFGANVVLKVRAKTVRLTDGQVEENVKN
jgi:hypothetical protein